MEFRGVLRLLAPLVLGRVQSEIAASVDRLADAAATTAPEPVETA